MNVQDLGDLRMALAEAKEIKNDRFKYQNLGKNKTLMMVFFNNSLRTRLSTQKAAMNLGMNVIVLDVNAGAWKLETERGVIMDGDKSGNFDPDSVVKFEDAIKVFVCMVGMDDELWIDPEDWSSAYLYCAEQNGLLDGLTGSKGEDMRCSDLAILADRMVTLLGTEKVAPAETVTADTEVVTEPETTTEAG